MRVFKNQSRICYCVINAMVEDGFFDTKEELSGVNERLVEYSFDEVGLRLKGRRRRQGEVLIRFTFI